MFKSLLACALVLGLTHAVRADDLQGNQVEFDSETLKSLGVDPDISHYFSREARFLPGKRSVSLEVNGKEIGNVMATFDDKGQLCFDKSLMEQAGLRIPFSYKQGCYDYPQAYPGTTVDLIPAQELIKLVVSPEQLQKQGLSTEDFITGGSAALLNYSLLTSRNNYSGEHSDYSQLVLDGGFNVSDWLFRSHQLISRADGVINSENSQNYLQRTFMKWKTTMRAGEVGINNRLLEGSNIYGVEFSPENALAEATSAVQVNGVASTSQARVEIRQQGILIYSTLVPAGPFTLTDIPLRNYTSNLDMTIVETDGNKRYFVIPSTLYSRNPGMPEGYHFAVGRVSDEYQKKPMVASLSGEWRLSPLHNLGGAVILANGYQGLGASLDSALLEKTIVSIQLKQSADRNKSLQGQQYQLTANTSALPGVGLSASVTRTAKNYREFSESLDDSFDSQNKYEYSLGVSFGNKTLGSFNTSLYKIQPFTGRSSRFVALNWGRRFEKFSVSASWQQQFGGESAAGGQGSTFYINISVPVGKQSVNAYLRHNQGQDRYGISTAGQLTDFSAYTITTEHDAQQRENSFSGGINSNLHYSQLNLNISTDGERSNSYSGSLQGGLAIHDNGITFSPLPVQDTFAIVQLDRPVSGVRLNTPQGPTWTDFRGQAVIPAVMAWKNSRVELNTETLPKNMDISNGVRILKQAKGSVGHVPFGTLTQRRVLLTLTTSDGKPLPVGVAITDAAGNYLTTSVDDGVVFLNDVDPHQALYARLNQGTCQLIFTLPDEPATDAFYENVKATCT